MWVWRHRYMELGAREDIDYVYIFENRGVEVGVTLHHPHGQIYGYPFLPPVPKLELAADRAPRRLRAVRAARARAARRAARRARERQRRRLRPLRRALGLRSARRHARAPRQPARVRAATSCVMLAGALQTLVRGYDALFERPFPYVMAVHQAPTASPEHAAAAASPPGTGTCTSSSTRRCAPPRSSSTWPAPSRAPAPSSPTRCPRSQPQSCARRSHVAAERSRAFAPGRVNLIGEHTDYNDGLALPFAIAEGVTVSAEAEPPGSPGAARISVYARDLGQRDEFDASSPARARGWRAFVRGVVAELARAGPAAGRGGCRDQRRRAPRRRPVLLSRARGRAVPRPRRHQRPTARAAAADRDRAAVLARGERLGRRAHGPARPARLAVRRARAAPPTSTSARSTSNPCRCALGDWRLVVLDSGERHVHASSGYNERRAECARACELLGRGLAA